jgi:hypothetical protein
MATELATSGPRAGRWASTPSTYYRWKGQLDRHGPEILRPCERRPPRMANATSPLVEQRVVPRVMLASARFPWPRWWWRPSAASCHPAATRRPWSSPALAVAQAATVGLGCQRAPGPCCRATTSTAPTRPRWPSWPTPPVSCGPRRLACSRCSELAAGRPPTSSPPHSPRTAGRFGQPRSRSPWANSSRPSWSPAPVTTVTSVGGRCPRPVTRCWRPWICTAPTTFATPSRPGWRTPASPPGSSMR